jgi:hypothetical protein
MLSINAMTGSLENWCPQKEEKEIAALAPLPLSHRPPAFFFAASTAFFPAYLFVT